MKKIAVVFIIVAFSACTPATMITGSWKSHTPPKQPYASVLVVALTSHAVAKASVENDLGDLLVKDGVHVSKGIDMFPPDITKSDSDRARLMHKIHGKGIEAILTVSVMKAETETRYEGPASRWDYYGNFWGYYTYWYPSFYSPAYYTERVYYIETNLYDAKSEKLMWSAQSKTYDLLDMAPFSKEFAQSIVSKLESDGMILKTPKVHQQTDLTGRK